MVPEVALALALLPVVVSFRGVILPWKRLVACANVQEFLKVKEELTATFDKLNDVLGGEEGKAAKDFLRDENLRVLWKKLGKGNEEGSVVFIKV